ncbi:MAG TPA: UPF0149 family protein, partial [Arenicellales bacterium]|nr:UPF0149 family protein [Arenicellales bacterium]
MHQQTTTHDRLQAALDLAGLEIRPSEIHGMVCGEICRRLRVGGSPGFTELLGMNDEPDGAQRNVLGIVDELAEESGQALDAGMQFSLLLPDEAESIGERTGALADWARGFVLALLRGDGLRIDDLEADSAEVVRDLFKISEAQPGGDDEEDERA